LKKKKLPILYTDNHEWCNHTATGWTHVFMDNKGNYKIAKTELSLKTAEKSFYGYTDYEFVMAFVGTDICGELYKALKDQHCNMYVTEGKNIGNCEDNYFTLNEARAMQKSTSGLNIYRRTRPVFQLSGDLVDVIDYVFDALKNRGYFLMEMISEEEAFPLSHPITKEILKTAVQKKAIKRMKAIIQKEEGDKEQS